MGVEQDWVNKLFIERLLWSKCMLCYVEVISCCHYDVSAQCARSYCCGSLKRSVSTWRTGGALL